MDLKKIVCSGKGQFKCGRHHKFFGQIIDMYYHGLRTPNEGINQSNLKIWADVADKICFDRT